MVGYIKLDDASQSFTNGKCLEITFGLFSVDFIFGLQGHWVDFDFSLSKNGQKT